MLAAAGASIAACSSDDGGPAAFPTNGGTPERRDASTSPTPTSPTPDSGGPKAPTSQCSTTPPTVGAPLTCAWLASTDNCWVKALAKVKSCGEVKDGLLSTDARSCVDGDATLAFAAPFPEVPLGADREVTYTMNGAEAGAACYQFTFFTPSANNRLHVSVAIASLEGCVSLNVDPDNSSLLTITCADGVAHTGDIAALTSACQTPGYSYSELPTGFGLGLGWGTNALGHPPGELVRPIFCHE
ncbi:MAG: hypothetical protein JWP97_1276 [Labilithrix sp.]|nr:hypothetical protein [Labilithrix sp.]